MFTNKILLITGGTGSFGNSVLKSFINSKIKEIRIFSRDEKKQEDMRVKYKNDKIKYFIGDVRDYQRLKDVMKGVDYIFHAAALKQVPSCEFFPLEATKTNVLGTSNVIKAAVESNVKRLVCLSTDKAAYPINAMGISKALMEKVAIAESRKITSDGPIVCVTRYGNVMASRGSVIPLFIKQIKEGSPITITNPKMTRFLMSLNEAVDLVLYAFKYGKQGDLFVQKSPATTINDLAISLKKIFKAKNEIKVIGARHGEKLYETLLTKEEYAKAVDLGNYFRVAADNRDLNYAKYLDSGDKSLMSETEYHSHNAKRLSINEIMDKVIGLDYLDELDQIKNKGI